MALRARTVFLGWLLAAVVIGATLIASLLAKTAIGLDPSAYPFGDQLQALGLALGIDADLSIAGLVATVLVILALLLATFFTVRGAVRARVAEVDPGRRSFLTGSASGLGAGLLAAAAAGGAGAARTFFGVGNDGKGWAGPGQQIFGGEVVKTHPDWNDAWNGARVNAHRRFGRTGFQVSDIVLGSGPLKGDGAESLVRAALDRGVNYIDTAPDYSATGSENIVGKAIRGRRDQLFLATKFCTPTGHLPPSASVSEFKAVIEASLGRLQTDYVDLVHIHSCDELDRLMAENCHEAFDRLKEEGKVRFLGFSSHTPNLEAVANRAIDSGRFDVMMLAYHYGLWPKIGDIIARARSEQDMGVVAMKTLKGGRHAKLEGFRDEANVYSQAALRWVLDNPNVSCAVISFFERQHVDEYLMASGGKLGENDLAVLRKYDQLVAGTHCAPHCGACLDTCPEGVPINDVLRHRMYFEDYGLEKEGMLRYSQLDKRADVCAGCSAPCTGSCPLGIPIQERLVDAHDMLTLG